MCLLAGTSRCVAKASVPTGRQTWARAVSPVASAAAVHELQSGTSRAGERRAPAERQDRRQRAEADAARGRGGQLCEAHSRLQQPSVDSAVDFVNTEIGNYISLCVNATICRMLQGQCSFCEWAFRWTFLAGWTSWWVGPVQLVSCDYTPTEAMIIPSSSKQVLISNEKINVCLLFHN